ncbi:MAG TPA: hypothetical protein VFU27_12335 [Terriglobales bacterium]|nr:hypothetical protein [Terriglobales bacterium]
MRAGINPFAEAPIMKNAMWAFVISGLMLFAPALFAQHMGGPGMTGGAHPAGGVARGGAVAHGGFGGGSGHGSGFGHGPSFGGRSIPVRRGIVGGFPVGHGRGFHNHRFFSPYLGGIYWWDDYGDSDTEQQGAVQQPPAQAAPAPQLVPEVKPANPLLIELQGDRFVSLTGNAVNSPHGTEGAAQPAASSPSEQLPPVVLVFRDGHRQEVTSYSIIGPAIYASGSYWTNGYWTQKILLASLDLPATLHLNQERGVNFVLPAAPNQVVTRP